MGRIWFGVGALVGGGAVGMGAIAAHALHGLNPAAAAAVDGAVQMQGWHALALLSVGLWVPRATAAARVLANLAGAAFCVGIALFCGGIYAHRLGGISLGPVAPAGGLTLIAAWLLLAASAFTAQTDR